MEYIGWILGITLAAVALDALLIWAWRKQQRSNTASDPIPSSDEVTPESSQTQITFDLAEGERIRFTVETLTPEQQPDRTPKSRIRVTIDTSETTQPSVVELIHRVRPYRRLIIGWLSSILLRLISIAEQAWDDLVDSEFAHGFKNICYRLQTWAPPLELSLFALSLTIYAITHFVGLEDFPIYFFTDEAVQTNLAADFIRDGFKNYDGVFFPTYFENDYLYNLSISVYIQIIPYLLFGKSVFVTRATSVLFTLTSAVAIGIILKEVFRIRHWWLGTLLLSITPVWFLHSRTAFETALFVSLYTWFILFYLLYRTRSPRYLHLALLFGGLAFYSYSAGQLVIVCTGFLLLLSDLKYHWKNRKTSLVGLGVLVLLVLPYLRFQLEFSGETQYHLRMLDSYWLHDIPLGEKLVILFQNLRRGLSPGYWFFPNNHDLIRHLMKDYGHILSFTLPFALLGLAISLKAFRSSPHRTVIAALLVTPLGGAIVGIGVTRVLAFVIPATIFTALGMDAVARWLTRRIPHSAIAITLLISLSIININMLRDALVNGPTWYDDYDLGGMQYGARQVFAAVKDFTTHDTESRVFVSPTWANGAHILQRFFVPDEPNVHMGNAGNYLLEMLDLDESTVFVLTPAEYEEVLNSEKITITRVERTVPFPDGRHGFYFVRMRYAPNAEAIFAEEREARRQPVTEEIILDGQIVEIQHSLFDMGEVKNLFDEDTFTMARTYEANPARIDLTFPEPRTFTGITVTTGSMDFTLTVRLFTDEQAEPITYSQTYDDLPEDPTVDLSFGHEPIKALKVEIEIFGFMFSEWAKIHIRELTLH